MAMAWKLLVLAVTLAVPPAAHASVESMRDSAVAYWAGQGVVGCPQGVTVEALPVDGQALGRAGIGGCWTVIDAGMTTGATAAIGATARGHRLYLLRERVRTLCATVYHEVGHALGLTHEYGGVMTQAFYGAEIPNDCFAYARELVHRKPRVRTSRSPNTASGVGQIRRPGNYAS